MTGGGAATTLAGGIPNKIASSMTAMARHSITMAIQTADGQIVVGNNRLYAGVPGLDIDGPRRVVAQGTVRTVHGIDAAHPAPGIGELGSADTANAMAGVTCCPPGEIGGPHQDGMGGTGMLGVASKISAMAGRALAARGMAGRTPLHLTVGCTMAAQTPLRRMDLPPRHKGSASRLVASGTVGSIGG